MILLFVSLSFVLGLIFGSFANVVVLRYGTGRSIKGRSSCPSCGHTLGALELIPVVSYLALRGRCKNCKTKISPQYALVELTFGLLFAACAYVAFSSLVAPMLYVFLAYAWISVFL